MSRYRPPAAPKSPLITPEGYKVLQDELDYLWRVKRPEITRFRQRGSRARRSFRKCRIYLW